MKVLQRLEWAVIKNKRILKCLLTMAVSLFLIINFSIGVSASGGYDRREVDACITISERLSVKGWKWLGLYSKRFRRQSNSVTVSVIVYLLVLPRRSIGRKEGWIMLLLYLADMGFAIVR